MAGRNKKSLPRRGVRLSRPIAVRPAPGSAQQGLLLVEDRVCRAALGRSGLTVSKREGDGATPEGDFYVFVKNNKSAYYLSLGVSYPNVEDAARGLRDGLITKAQHDAIVEAQRKKVAPPQYTKLGGLIYIHGNGSSSDWTLGCVALENEDMKELFDSVTVGTPVTIKP